MKTSAPFSLVLDVGTTAIKVIAFDAQAKAIKRVVGELEKHRPKRGWVEQNPEDLVDVSRRLLREMLSADLDIQACTGLGITNQRETSILWDRDTGETVYPAIVWEDTRTVRWCAALKPLYGETIRARTGLRLEPYFSASEIVWIIENVAQARQLLSAGRLAFGTVDSWLLWNLCDGHPHLTDPTNASRTLLYNIIQQAWDPELLKIFSLEASLLPTVQDSRSSFGVLRQDVAGAALPVRAVCGDQQASMFAALHDCHSKLCTKVTYGTGTFIMQELGAKFAVHDPFYTTLVPAVGGGVEFALEAKIDRGGKEVEKILGDDEKLDKFLNKLAREVNGYLKLLPHKPDAVMIDGGVSRDGRAAACLTQVSGLPTVALPIFDGTSLGTAMLML